VVAAVNSNQLVYGKHPTFTFTNSYSPIFSGFNQIYVSVAAQLIELLRVSALGPT
jgi:hypothetical protein